MATTQRRPGTHPSIVIARRPQADVAIYAEVPLATYLWIAPCRPWGRCAARDDEEGMLKFILNAERRTGVASVRSATPALFNSRRAYCSAKPS